MVISRELNGGWQDVAFADEVPDAKVVAASLLVTDEHVVAAYVLPRADGTAVCRVVQMDGTPDSFARPASWERLPAHPSGIGVAGVLAGVHDGVLIAAGGANFPEGPPWAGGKKVSHDAIHVLRPGDAAWRPAGRLPEPRAYSAVLSLPDGLLVAGGENAETIFQDTLLLRWDGEAVVIERGPDLPAPVTSAVAAVLDGQVYVAGGYEAGPPRASRGDFWRLDPTNPAGGWTALPSWPGPARAQGTIAALDGGLYLISGLELQPGPDGKPQAIYLNDAYRYRPAEGWERLPDLPWSAIAAPSPAPVTAAPARVFVLGGVDGRQAGQLPRDTRLPDDILYFDVAARAWRLWPEPWPQPVVTAPAIRVGDRWIIVSGETMAGVRTPEVWSWSIGKLPTGASRAD